MNTNICEIVFHKLKLASFSTVSATLIYFNKKTNSVTHLLCGSKSEWMTIQNQTKEEQKLSAWLDPTGANGKLCNSFVFL